MPMPHPAGKLLDPWRRRVNCLFGLTLSGVADGWKRRGRRPHRYDPTGTYQCANGVGSDGNTWQNFTTPGTQSVPQVDRLPLEAVVGWNATVNGNLAEQLQEPSLMGAYEGAGITVLGKGVWTSPGESVWTDAAERGAFPIDALLLQDVPASPNDDRSRRWDPSTPIASLQRQLGQRRMSSRPTPTRATSSATRRRLTASASPTAPRAEAASSFTAGRITCKSPTTGFITMPVRSRAECPSARVNFQHRSPLWPGGHTGVTARNRRVRPR